MRIASAKNSLRPLLVSALIGLGWCTGAHATGLFSGTDAEKPVPEFTRSGDRITATFIPRAKSSRVAVEFAVPAGGTIGSVEGVDFVTVDRPEVDIKNFKSAAFAIEIRDVIPGGTATVAMRSDFFSLSTAFYIFNPNRAAPWLRDCQKENRLLENRVREIIVEVQDGGERDADGAVNGRIRLVGGPRDSFWGYALGTLFIRFFGIFFVLSLLMVGMLISGRIFSLLDRVRGRSADALKHGELPPAAGSPSAEAPESDAATAPAAIPETVVAAIGAALYLRETAPRAAAPSGLAAAAAGGTAWTDAGRQRIMHERLAVFRQADRK